MALKILDGEVHPGDDITVDADPNADAMRFERAAVKAGAA
jgi:hypothetical protein